MTLVRCRSIAFYFIKNNRSGACLFFEQALIKEKLPIQTISFKRTEKSACAEYGLFSDFFARVDFPHTAVFVLEITICGNTGDDQTFFRVAFEGVTIFGIDRKQLGFSETYDMPVKQKALTSEYDGNAFSFSRDQFTIIRFLIHRNGKRGAGCFLKNGYIRIFDLR